MNLTYEPTKQELDVCSAYGHSFHQVRELEFARVEACTECGKERVIPKVEWDVTRRSNPDISQMADF